MVYASETRALASLLEFYVHLSRPVILPGLCVVSIEIPDTVTRKEITVADLPGGWRAYPAPPELATIGAEWVSSGESLLLRVPSTVMPPECNVLINPAHLEMKNVHILEIEKYVLESASDFIKMFDFIDQPAFLSAGKRVVGSTKGDRFVFLRDPKERKRVVIPLLQWYSEMPRNLSKRLQRKG